MEIAPGVYFISNPTSGWAGSHESNVYVVGDLEVVLIDAGAGQESSLQAKLDYLHSLGNPRLRSILLTHGHHDHLLGAQRLKALTGAQLLVHPADAGQVTKMLGAASVDGFLNDGDTLTAGKCSLQVIHTPGHTLGHVCFFMASSRVLFTGDHVVGMGTTVVGPPDGDMALYVASLQQFLTSDIDLICPGHGPMVKEPKAKIRELISHRLEREAQVLAALARGKNTVNELVEEIYPELAPSLVATARRTVAGHLIKLEREGRVYRAEGKDAFFLRG